MSLSRWWLAALLLSVVASAARADDPFALSRRAMDMTESLPLSKASVNGKYRNLLRAINCPMDRPNYGDFRDYGYYTGADWHGHRNLPAGHWVYVYPRWYIWGEKVK